ncbi:hypothetical protein C9374_001222 [Naegleria lovaniensis]|uniref:Uncharacterized protein n=1 Tax=Naegleria lovaniensis TaxID=51637 RepID=A0AA88GXR6_NAELO|nr:uncharacterized protein C9374_001222 [Naegleria lovaniensis]KAG2387628.1 hypothetical protein C9374_001222 [Naegleria lovaniensis]
MLSSSKLLFKRTFIAGGLKSTCLVTSSSSKLARQKIFSNSNITMHHNAASNNSQIRERQKLLFIEHPNHPDRVFLIPTINNGNPLSMNLLMTDIQESLADHEVFSGHQEKKVVDHDNLNYPKDHHKRIVDIISQKSFKEESKDPLDALFKSNEALSTLCPVTKNKQLLHQERIIPRNDAKSISGQSDRTSKQQHNKTSLKSSSSSSSSSAANAASNTNVPNTDSGDENK